MRTQRLGSLLVVFAALAVPATVHAQAKPATTKPAPKEDPKQKYAGAVKKFGDKDYAGALVDFQQLDALKSTPQSLRYIALCLDKLGRTAEAVTWYEKFVANPPGKLQTEFDEAKKRLEELTKKAAPKLHVETTPAGAVILVDGKAVGVAPKDLDLPAGKHRIHLELPGYEPIDKDVDAFEKELRTQLDKKAETVDVPPTSTPTTGDDATPPTPAAPTPDGPVNNVKPPTFIPAIVTGGLAVVTLGFGIGFGVAALGNKSDFDTTPNASSADAGRTNAVICEMMFGAAIMLGVTSAVLFFSNGSKKPTATTTLTVHPHPIVTQHGGGVGALVRF